MGELQLHNPDSLPPEKRLDPIERSGREILWRAGVSQGTVAHALFMLAWHRLDGQPGVLKGITDRELIGSGIAANGAALRKAINVLARADRKLMVRRQPAKYSAYDLWVMMEPPLCPQRVIDELERSAERPPLQLVDGSNGSNSGSNRFEPEFEPACQQGKGDPQTQRGSREKERKRSESEGIAPIAAELKATGLDRSTAEKHFREQLAGVPPGNRQFNAWTIVVALAQPAASTDGA